MMVDTDLHDQLSADHALLASVIPEISLKGKKIIFQSSFTGKPVKTARLFP